MSLLLPSSAQCAALDFLDGPAAFDGSDAECPRFRDVLICGLWSAAFEDEALRDIGTHSETRLEEKIVFIDTVS